MKFENVTDGEYFAAIRSALIACIVVSYPTLSASHHFIRHLTVSGKKWADIFISALEGACAIKNFNRKELIKNYHRVLHDASVDRHRSRTGTNDLGTVHWERPYIGDKQIKAGSTSSSLLQGPCRWSWNRRYVKPVITVLPGAIDHV